MLQFVALLILVSRGCYHGNHMVNGRELDSRYVATTGPKVAFRGPALRVFFLEALLSMPIPTWDHHKDRRSLALSRPIGRWLYMRVKVPGPWLLRTLFMAISRGIIFSITFLFFGNLMPGRQLFPSSFPDLNHSTSGPLSVLQRSDLPPCRWTSIDPASPRGGNHLRGGL